MKRFIRLLSAMLALLLCVGTACADGLLLNIGSEGDEVTRLQERLIELGYLTGEPSGVYDEATADAVLRYQKANWLFATGIADDITLESIFSDGALPYEEDEDDYFESGEYEVADSAVNMLAPSGMSYKSATSFEIAYEPLPDLNTEEYGFRTDNGFISASAMPLSTFSAETDTASWSILRKKLLAGAKVAPDTAHIEEMLNYFHYDYAEPTGNEPFGVTMELAHCPWNEKALLMQIGLQARKVEANDRGQNIVFLVDVSGSMDEPDKLPLVQRAFSLLLESLSDSDTISVVTYASGTEVRLDGKKGADRLEIAEVIADLTAGGYTNGGAGLRLAYDTAERHFIKGGNNRIIMATDGDLNVGESSEGDLARLVLDYRDKGVALTVLGFGLGNIKDNKMQALAQYGGGSYHYVDSVYEARRALITETGASFDLVASDVKLQLDFNPARVGAYRLIGYENRLLEADDFANDNVGGGELGSGHRVTVLYEILPPEEYEGASSRYTGSTGAADGDWCTLAVRCKLPGESESTLFEYPFSDEVSDTMSDNMRFAAAVTEVGMLLRESEYAGTASYETALDLLRDCGSVMGDPFKEEFLYITGLLAR